MTSEFCNAKTTVFYDGGCRLCSREIDHYRKLDADQRIEWLDINEDPDVLNAAGVSYEQAMRRMHVMGADGVLRDGVSAFAAMWSQLPYYRFLAGLLYKTGAARLLEPVYTRFASWRYDRRRNRQRKRC